MYRNHNVIATTFAGRSDRMPLLVGNMIKSLKESLIDEYHVWDFSKNQQDKNWIKILPSLHPQIKVFIQNNDNFHETYSNINNKPDWRPYYRHYTNKTHNENTVLLKIDDDIVYLDTTKLKQFIDFRIDNPEYLLVSANVVNNGITTGLQQRYGAIPASLCPPNGIPYESYCGKLWEDGLLAEKLHFYFIKNKQKFHKEGFYIQPIGERISINFVSWLGKDFKYTSECTNDDESYLSIELSKKLNRNNCVFYPLLVSHLSFNVQEESMNIHKILSEYNKLQTEEYADSIIEKVKKNSFDTTSMAILFKQEIMKMFCPN